MNQEFSHTELQALALVRASLWQQRADEECFSKVTADWGSIARLALRQTVGGLLFEAALSLPRRLAPPKEWIRKALSFIECNHRTHLLIDGCVAEAVTRLEEVGIPAVLLKGEAYARAYPRPGMRQCGDIDLYVGEEIYRKACSAIKGFGWEGEEEFDPEAKHYGCRLRGIHIELHRVTAMLSSRRADKRFRLWSRSQTAISGRTVTIGGRDIPVPTPAFDIVFVFLHLYRHFLNGGVGLRHICDWVMLLHAHCKAIDRRELETLLRRFRLMRGWRIFAPIAVDRLGLPPQECPFYSPSYIEKADRVLAFILKEGNFGRGHHDDALRPPGYLAGKIYALRRHTASVKRKLWIDPATISGAYCSYLGRGLRVILNDMMKKGACL